MRRARAAAGRILGGAPRPRRPLRRRRRDRSRPLRWVWRVMYVAYGVLLIPKRFASRALNGMRTAWRYQRKSWPSSHPLFSLESILNVLLVLPDIWLLQAGRSSLHPAPHICPRRRPRPRRKAGPRGPAPPGDAAPAGPVGRVRPALRRLPAAPRRWTGGPALPFDLHPNAGGA